MATEFSALMDDFVRVAALAGVPIDGKSLRAEVLSAPHEPTALPAGKMAVYVFTWNDQCLKVGKVGPNSNARYQSQHYLAGSSRSNLARSILASRDELGLHAVSDANVGRWIKANVDRANFLLDASAGIRTLTLLETFLQCRLQPRFEGFERQR